MRTLGVPLGVFQTIPMVYALEISPTCLRAHLTTYVNLCWVCENYLKISFSIYILLHTDLALYHRYLAKF